MKYIVSLRVQVEVDASSPSDAEKKAFEQGDILRRSDRAHVSAAQCVREAGPGVYVTPSSSSVFRR